MKKIINILVLAVIVGGTIYFWQSKYPLNKASNKADVAAEISQEVKSNNANAPKAVLNFEFVFSGERKENVAYELPANASFSLFALSKKVAEQQNWSFEFKDYGDLGILVTKIDQIANGADNKFWQYYINGKMPQVGASNYFPKTNDKIKWVFETSKF